MKIKLDENLPSRVASLLNGMGHDVHTVFDEGLAGRPDGEVWEAAQRESRFLITQDLDFADLRRFVPGSHSGILLIRLHSPDLPSLITRVAEIFREENVQDWQRCFVVSTEHKLRVVQP